MGHEKAKVFVVEKKRRDKRGKWHPVKVYMTAPEARKQAVYLKNTTPASVGYYDWQFRKYIPAEKED